MKLFQFKMFWETAKFLETEKSSRCWYDMLVWLNFFEMKSLLGWKVFWNMSSRWVIFYFTCSFWNFVELCVLLKTTFFVVCLLWRVTPRPANECSSLLGGRCLRLFVNRVFVIFETVKSSEIAKSFETAKSFANYDFWTLQVHYWWGGLHLVWSILCGLCVCNPLSQPDDFSVWRLFSLWLFSCSATSTFVLSFTSRGFSVESKL